MTIRSALCGALGLAAICASSAFALADNVVPLVKTLSNPSPTHLLFVGNSYLYYGDSMHGHVRRMVVAAGVYDAGQLKYKSATISGAALRDHPIDSYLEPGRLRVEKPFQVVILQGGSTAALGKGRDERFRAAVAEYAEKIRTAGGEPALYMTHAFVPPHRRYDPEMIRAIEALYVSAGNENGALVIPVGLAFEEAYRQRPDIKLHKDFDGSHPDLLGTYLAAATVFASLYGQSPVGVDYDYYGKIDKETALFLQQVAQKTVTEFYGRK